MYAFAIFLLPFSPDSTITRFSRPLDTSWASDANSYRYEASMHARAVVRTCTHAPPAVRRYFNLIIIASCHLQEFKLTSKEHVVESQADGWTKFEVPLSAFKCEGALEQEVLDRLDFQNIGESDVSFCLDELRLVR